MELNLKSPEDLINCNKEQLLAYINHLHQLLAKVDVYEVAKESNDESEKNMKALGKAIESFKKMKL